MYIFDRVGCDDDAFIIATSEAHATKSMARATNFVAYDM